MDSSSRDGERPRADFVLMVLSVELCGNHLLPERKIARFRDEPSANSHAYCGESQKVRCIVHAHLTALDERVSRSMVCFWGVRVINLPIMRRLWERRPRRDEDLPPVVLLKAGIPEKSAHWSRFSGDDGLISACLRKCRTIPAPEFRWTIAEFDIHPVGGQWQSG